MTAPAAGLPVLGLDLDPPGPAVVRLLGELARWCRPTAVGTGGAVSAEAVLVQSGRAVPAGLRAAVLVDAPAGGAPAAPGAASGAGRPDAPAVVAVLTADESVLAGAGSRGVALPTGDPVPGAAYVPPFVRERLRRARGLPAAAVLVPVDPRVGGTANGWRWPGRSETLPEDLVPTAFAAAAAVVAPDPRALTLAGAWGTPAVTTAAVAAGTGHRDGVDVVVADGNDLGAAAAGLAADVRTAARLAWAGRRRYERRHEPARAAAELAVRLLPLGARGDLLPVAQSLHLALLGTPAAAPNAARAREALDGLRG